jgi:hypothetical protein
MGPQDALLFADATRLRLFPPLRAAWARMGEQAVVPVTGRDQCSDGPSPYGAVAVRDRAGGARVTRGGAPPLPPGADHLAVARSGAGPYGCTHATTGPGVGHRTGVAAHTMAGTQRHGPTVARTEATCRRQPASGAYRPIGPGGGRLAAGAQYPRGADQSGHPLSPFLASLCAAKLLLRYLAVTKSR